mmetsp:Transcript_36074/g.73406  ORF Transcript_36074/g.73406 Transcript_36074/m.73406 type:complete len:287 (-) Transcript_36074:756-1616(-)
MGWVPEMRTTRPCRPNADKSTPRFSCSNTASYSPGTPATAEIFATGAGRANSRVTGGACRAASKSRVVVKGSCLAERLSSTALPFTLMSRWPRCIKDAPGNALATTGSCLLSTFSMSFISRSSVLNCTAYIPSSKSTSMGAVPNPSSPLHRPVVTAPCPSSSPPDASSSSKPGRRSSSCVPLPPPPSSSSSSSKNSLAAAAAAASSKGRGLKVTTTHPTGLRDCLLSPLHASSTSFTHRAKQSCTPSNSTGAPSTATTWCPARGHPPNFWFAFPLPSLCGVGGVAA